IFFALHHFKELNTTHLWLLPDPVNLPFPSRFFPFIADGSAKVRSNFLLPILFAIFIFSKVSGTSPFPLPIPPCFPSGLQR
ncbi:hypothetical protein, partial [Algoriphagus iocasae]|uniref:hypothetical protein n=1 Tax=Algoriphagus iocasae TaxID=1836499 RepID=UPI001C872CDF